MYNVKKVTQCLFGRIGFTAVNDIDLALLDDDLRRSDSGRYWEEAHALITLEILQSIAKNQDASNWPPYNAIKNYPKGSVVYAGGANLKVALQDTSAGIPPTDAAYWGDTSPFSAWVRKKIEASIKNLIDAVITKKKVKESVKGLLENAQIFTGAGNYQDKELKQGRFVGYRIVFKDFQNLQAIINSIGTQFSESFDPGESINLYLYHTSNFEPLAIYNLVPTKKMTVQWFDQETITLQSGSDYDIGGAYFIGYYENDLPLGMQAINRTNYNFNTGPCSTCGNADIFNFQKWFKYVSFSPVAVSSSFLNPDRNIFDFDQVVYYNVDKTFGLNFRVSIGCEISNVICNNKSIFDDALLHQFGVDMLKEMVHSIEINHIQERVKQTSIMFELDDRADSNQKGLVSELNDKIKALNFDLSDIDDVCLACGERRGINYTSI